MFRPILVAWTLVGLVLLAVSCDRTTNGGTNGGTVPPVGTSTRILSFTSSTDVASRIELVSLSWAIEGAVELPGWPTCVLQATAEGELDITGSMTAEAKEFFGDEAFYEVIDCNDNIAILPRALPASTYVDYLISALKDPTAADARTAYEYAEIRVRLVGSGEVVWIDEFGTDDGDWVEALTLDEAEQPLVAGRTFGSLGAVNKGSSDVFLRRYTHSGSGPVEPDWTHQFGTPQRDAARHITVDTNGDIALVSSLDEERYLHKFRPDGVERDTSPTPLVGLGFPHGVTTGLHGRINLLASSYDSDLAATVGRLANISPTGATIWQVDIVLDGSSSFGGLATDTGGATYVSFHTRWSEQVVVEKYDTNGFVAWRHFVPVNYPWRTRIDVDGVGNVLLAINYEDDWDYCGRLLLVKIAPNGAPEWERSFGSGNTSVSVAGIAVDGDGNTFIASSVFDDCYEEYGVTRSLVMKVNSDGDDLWSRDIRINDGQSVQAIAVTAAGNAYITGTTTTNVGFDNIRRAFVARLSK